MAGRKKLYGEQTKTISFKVPESKVKEFKLFVKTYLSTMKIKSNSNK